MKITIILFSCSLPPPTPGWMVVRKRALEISVDLISAPGTALAWRGTRQSEHWCMGDPIEGRRQGAEEGSRPLSPYAGGSLCPGGRCHVPGLIVGYICW